MEERDQLAELVVAELHAPAVMQKLRVVAQAEANAVVEVAPGVPRLMRVRDAVVLRRREAGGAGPRARRRAGGPGARRPAR